MDETYEQLKRREQAMEFRVIDPAGAKKAPPREQPPVYCRQCGELVTKLVFCCLDCEKNYERDITETLDATLPFKG